MKIRLHFKIHQIVIGFLVSIIVAGVVYFFVEINPMLNPRMKTAADFAHAYWDIEILCRWRMRVSDGAESIKVRKIRVSAYTDREEETDSNPQETSSGKQPYVGSCAVSPDIAWLIEEGDKVYIPALNRKFIREDVTNHKTKTGKPIKRTIDIFFHKEDLEEARKVLIENATIYVSKIEREKEKK